MKIKHKRKTYEFKEDNWFYKNELVEQDWLLEELNEKLNEKEIGTEGIGDVIEKITKSVGIKPCEECDKRKEKFNKLFHWLRPNRCLTEDESKFINDKLKAGLMTSDEAKYLFSLYNEVFSAKLKKCKCSGLINKMLNRLSNIG